MGLDCVFKALEKDCVLYLKVLELYIHAKTPFKLNGYSQINICSSILDMNKRIPL